MSDAELASAPTVYREGLCDGQVVVVSGAGSGLGRAIASLYARLGATLVVCGRDGEALDEAAGLFRSLGATVSTRAMSIREPARVAALMDEVWDRHGRLDALVNNAGGQFPQRALDFTVKGWNAVVDTNLNGTWHMMQAAARRWVDAGAHGSIVNIVAVVERGFPGIAHTAAARGGVIALSRTVAVEWAEHRIRVNCVAPGVVETAAFGLYPDSGRATFMTDANPMRHPGDAYDVAEAVVYLTAASGKFVTGELLHIDGGQRLWGDPWPTGRPAYFRT